MTLRARKVGVMVLMWTSYAGATCPKDWELNNCTQ